MNDAPGIRMQLGDALVEVSGDSIRVLKPNFYEEKSEARNCGGDACADIDMQFNTTTNSYWFYNDGNKNVRLEVRQGSVFGCGGWRSRNMRPTDEWDSGFYGVCEHKANYR